MTIPYFTIFTPVYNRRGLIHRVWGSLTSQTCNDFEWIVVDDGSTDNVLELLQEYKAQADFPVLILTQENSGKHFGWNRAVQLAKGQLFVPADSDDEFNSETLERFMSYWNAIPIPLRSQYSGINVLCKDQTGQLVGDPFPYDLMVSNNLELYYKYKLKGEKWGCLRTDLLRQRPFPEVKGRGNFPATYLFFWLAKYYKVLCVNEVLRTYYTDLQDSISAKMAPNLHKSAESIYLSLAWHLDDNINYIIQWQGYSRTYKNFVGFWRIGLITGRDFNTIMKGLSKKASKSIALFSFLPGYFYFVWSMKIVGQRKS